MTHFRFDEYLCAVCRRPASGLAVAAKGRRNSPLAWVCDDSECIQIAKDSFDMRQTEFSRLDEKAAIMGGDSAGQYLDSIGKTDLAKLDEKEWQTFCRTLVGAYRESLKTTLKDEAPF